MMLERGRPSAWPRRSSSPLPGPAATARTRAVAVILALTPWLIVSCASTQDPSTGDLRRDLVHRDPLVRVEATVRAEREGRRDLVAYLVENLSHEDANVRMVSGVALRRLTGEDFGFLPYATPHARAEAVDRWRQWLSTAPPGFEASGSEGESPPRVGDRAEDDGESSSATGSVPVEDVEVSTVGDKS